MAIPFDPGDSQEVNCPKGTRETTLGCASVLCSALRADFVGCALHASADAVARNDMKFEAAR